MYSSSNGESWDLTRDELSGRSRKLVKYAAYRGFLKRYTNRSVFRLMVSSKTLSVRSSSG